MPPPSTPSIKLLPTGASLQQFLLPLSTSSTPINLVLSFPFPSSYRENPFYIGSTIGRYANRIRHGHLPLPSDTHKLPTNNGPHTLHGGPTPWSSRDWSGPTYELTSDGIEAAVFTLHSANGDNGFPGAVDAKARYAAVEVVGKGGRKEVRVEVEYEAYLTEGSETVVNMTNHSYFNLCPGKETTEGTKVKLASNMHIPLDSTGVPLKGCDPQVYSVKSSGHGASNEEGGKLEFTLTEKAPVVDDYFIFSDVQPHAVPLDTRKLPLRECARFYHHASRVHLVVETTEPGFQFYTGDYLDLEVEDKKIGPRAGFCVEPGRWSDAAGREEWREMVMLRKGDRWGSRIVYTAWEGEENE
ncbi:galactose mutarotase-like protein [Ascodesmis nigricans]|uniref:Galactose mutarotase-like protein n=1 Tax=Ascodesmis nigricans TaxID=341454 RepID=A0A4S2N285_9PEZI|nr:galactose mutarotase-like protein [Ascodesmis nigricans]